MYTLKSMVRRGTMLGAAVAVFAAAIVPAAPVFADSLNPLTERSLLLSSSAPGFQDTDGSGNSFAVPNSVGQNYAPAGSGPNGKKTGETFAFKTSTTPSSEVSGFSLQYCTLAAGWCRAPGNNPGDADPDNNGVATGTPGDRALNGDATGHADGKSDFEFVSNFTHAGAGNVPTAGQFQVYVNGAPSTSVWTFAKSNLENTQYVDTAAATGLTGKNNYVTLAAASPQTVVAGQEVQIVFKPSEAIYITNPGANAFFVKINTYNTGTPSAMIGSHNDSTPLDTTDAPSHTVIDGGVTVANVMTDSIHITTKVLETMAFSVGTRNRDTVTLGGSDTHGPCDAIQVVNNNRLNLGNPNAEYSLETSTAWDVYSYWRLSSNSSGGATVYYSGNTLANTVGDEIAEMGPAATTSLPGAPQFGLGFVDATTDDETPTDKFDPAFKTLVAGVDDRFKMPTLDVLTPAPAYANGTGAINGTPTATFAFEKSSNTVPKVIAEDTDDVISCDTAKMRYVANIGADTPAGVYTTKINYLAAPQY